MAKTLNVTTLVPGHQEILQGSSILLSILKGDKSAWNIKGTRKIDFPDVEASSVESIAVGADPAGIDLDAAHDEFEMAQKFSQSVTVGMDNEQQNVIQTKVVLLESWLKDTGYKFDSFALTAMASGTKVNKLPHDFAGTGIKAKIRKGVTTLAKIHVKANLAILTLEDYEELLSSQDNTIRFSSDVNGEIVMFNGLRVVTGPQVTKSMVVKDTCFNYAFGPQVAREIPLADGKDQLHYFRIYGGKVSKGGALVCLLENAAAPAPGGEGEGEGEG